MKNEIEVITPGCSPFYGTNFSAGADLRAAIDGQVFPGEINKIPLGVRTRFVPDVFGLIKARSGLAVKYGMDVLAGVIDPDYRGELHAVITVLKPFSYSAGDRIVQLLALPYRAFEAVSTGNADARGANGFGSTGV
jgi:dUTP pyrophosphatase